MEKSVDGPRRHLGSTGQARWRRWLGLGSGGQAADAEVCFAPGFLEALERLRLLALRATGGGLREGRRLGAYRGGQLEFHDYRSYAPGDDLRYLDWNLYARLEKPFIKEFAREEAGTIHLLLDATPSMALGTPAKWTFARRLAALFAHVGWSAHDVVHAHVFRGAGMRLASYPPRGVKAATPEFLQWLQREPCASAPASAAPAGSSAEPLGSCTEPVLPFAKVQDARAPQGALRAGPAAGGVSEPRASASGVSAAPSRSRLGPAARVPEGALLAALREFLRGAPARGRVFLISDFWQDAAETAAAMQRLAASGHDLAAVHVLATGELAPPEPGEWRIFAAEDPGEVELSLTAGAAARYAAEFEAHRAAVESSVRRRGGLYLLERSDTPLERVLIRTLRQRRWLG